MDRSEDNSPKIQFNQFQEWATQKETGDLEFDSLSDGISHLKQRVKKV